MKRAGIVGIGFWAPSTVRRNDAWSEEFVRGFHEHREARRKTDFTDHGQRSATRAYDELYAKHVRPYDADPFKGAVERRVADPAIPGARGDTVAAGRALEDAGVGAEAVDLVMSSAIPQDKLCPSNAPAVAQALGCKDVATLGLETYCASPVAQLDLAAALVESGRARYVLCVSSHQMARINDLRLPASPVFGDASSAFLVGEVPENRGVMHVLRGGDPSLRDGVALAVLERPDNVWWKGVPGPVVPGSDDLSAAKHVGQNLLRYPIDTLRELLESAKVPVDAVGVLSMIQPSTWFQAAVAEGLGIQASRVPSTYADFAHIGGCAIAANLLEARRAGLLNDGTVVAVYGHGAGFTRYAALLRWHERPRS